MCILCLDEEGELTDQSEERLLPLTPQQLQNWVLKPGAMLLLGVIQVAANRSEEGAWLVSLDLFIVCYLLLAAEHMVFAWATDFKNKYICNPGRVLPAVNMFVVHMVKTGLNDEKGVILCVSQSLSKNNLLYF